jgi:hypothetical protein
MKTSRRLSGVLLGLLLASCLLSSSPASDVITLQVTAEQANIREKPDIMSPVLQQVATGGILEAERKEGEWYAVRVDLDTGGTVIGYVHESLVRVVGGTPATTRPTPKVVKEPPQEEVKALPAEPKETPKPPPPVPAAPKPAPEQRMGRPSRESENPRASLTLWYGGRYAVVGDLNDGAKGMSDFFASQLGVKKSADVGSVHLGRFFGAEYRHPLVRGLDVAIGAEYFSAERASTVNFEGRPATTLFQTTPSVRVIPVSLSLVFYPVSNIYVKAGADLAIAHCEYLYRFEEGDNFREWQGKANAIGLGYALAAGMEWRVAGPVSVLAEAGYRRTRVGGLDGEEIYRESGKTDVQTKGTLYFFREAASASLTVPQVFIRAAIPAGAGVVEARKAELSLSGLSLRVGLKVAF